MTHPLDRRRKPRPKPKTHHVYRDTSPAEDGMPNAVWLLRPSWRALLLNLSEVVKLCLIPFFFTVMAVICWVVASANDGTVTEAIFTGLFGVALFGSLAGFMAILPAFALIQLRSSRAEVVVAADEFYIGLSLFWRFLGVNLLLSVLTIGGLLLLIVPGLLALQRYQLAPYYVLDKELGVIEALKAAAADARRYKRPLWSLTILTVISRVSVFIPYAGPFIAAILQLLYFYAPAVRYVEIEESAKRRK